MSAGNAAKKEERLKLVKSSAEHYEAHCLTVQRWEEEQNGERSKQQLPARKKKEGGR